MSAFVRACVYPCIYVYMYTCVYIYTDINISVHVHMYKKKDRESICTYTRVAQTLASSTLLAALWSRLGMHVLAGRHSIDAQAHVLREIGLGPTGS